MLRISEEKGITMLKDSPPKTSILVTALLIGLSSSPALPSSLEDSVNEVIEKFDSAQTINDSLDNERTHLLRRLKWYRLSHPRSADAYYWSGKVYGLSRDDFFKARELLLRSLELDPKRPDTWHHLGNIYSHGTNETPSGLKTLQRALARARGSQQIPPLDPDADGFIAKLALVCFETTVLLSENDSIENRTTYLETLATFVSLYRKDAMEYYGENEDHIFQRSLDIYSQARRLDPQNFDIAYGLASTFFAMKDTSRWQEGELAYLYAIALARNEHESRVTRHGLISYARRCHQDEAVARYRSQWPDATK